MAWYLKTEGVLDFWEKCNFMFTIKWEFVVHHTPTSFHPLLIQSPHKKARQEKNLTYMGREIKIINIRFLSRKKVSNWQISKRPTPLEKFPHSIKFWKQFFSFFIGTWIVARGFVLCRFLSVLLEQCSFCRASNWWFV